MDEIYSKNFKIHRYKCPSLPSPKLPVLFNKDDENIYCDLDEINETMYTKPLCVAPIETIIMEPINVNPPTDSNFQTSQMAKPVSSKTKKLKILSLFLSAGYFLILLVLLFVLLLLLQGTSRKIKNGLILLIFIGTYIIIE